MTQNHTTASSKPARAKHTPGPWIVDSDNDVELGENAGSWILLPAYHKDTPANAKLIAAAPEMLEALQFVKKFFAMHAAKGNPEPSQIVNAVHKAIDAAGGY